MESRASIPIRAVRAALSVLSALSAAALVACASHYCGAPCDKPARPAAPADVHVNQYGSLYGYLEVDSLPGPKLIIEKNSLEFLLKANPRDAEILKALKAEGDSAYAFRYDDYSTGGDRFDASGKLRRPAATEAGVRRIARLVGESRNRELFERYRRVRLRLIGLERSEPPRDTAAPPPADTTWRGRYRAGSAEPVEAPGPFATPDACARWAAEEAGAWRDRAYGFEFECRRGTEVYKSRIW